MNTFRQSQRSNAWVVYQAAVKGHPTGPNAVCDQAAWEALEASAPGHNRLIRAGIPSEGEAERLARGNSGDSVPRGTRATAA
ncbi:hypothetical protein [Urbifossiella limnaea]|uniref:Uncharacterized protein n=1 Tax=Urbifossiella limnaea TaxID=2528023 RepID=A0A517XQE4_9BACT|nr:hypothetical protein [Urbifossiella limnaea]QDU19720.1 hypothetical protein ETAA1_16560 [Urbifossiella limnaea]